MIIQSKKLLKQARRLGKKAALTAATASAAAVVSTQTFALGISTADLQAQLDTAQATAEEAIGLGQGAILAIVVLVMGFAYLLSLIKSR